MKMSLEFGEKVEGYKVRVLNEREVRAAAGILFAIAVFSFLNAWHTGNFFLMKVFIVVFLIDFGIRIFINPKYSPSMIIGRIAVEGQKVEYTGAAQKKFAWGIGFVLAAAMFFILVIGNIISPLNLLICLICLTLLFFESAFGICIGCKLYNYIKKDKAQLCPGGACEDFKKEKIQEVRASHTFFALVFIALVIVVSTSGVFGQFAEKEQNVVNTDSEIIVEEDCEVPDWAVSIGHKDLWKTHNDC